jgi:hypothetical protein
MQKILPPNPPQPPKEKKLVQTFKNHPKTLKWSQHVTKLSQRKFLFKNLANFPPV